MNLHNLTRDGIIRAISGPTTEDLLADKWRLERDLICADYIDNTERCFAEKDRIRKALEGVKQQLAARGDRLAAELSFNRDRKDHEPVTDSSLTYGDLRLLAKQSSMIAEAARGIEEYSCRTSVSHIATEMSALAERLRQATHRENDGLEHCGNFSATDPITDEDRIAYWKGAYEHMAARNYCLNSALKQIRDQHIPDQPAAYGGTEYDWVVRQYANLRSIAKDAVEG